MKEQRSKPTGKRSLGKPTRWEDKTTMYLEEIDVNRRNWVDSAHLFKTPCECGGECC